MRVFFALTLLLFYSMTLEASCRRITSLSASTDAKAIAAGYTARSWTGIADGYEGQTGLPHTIDLSSNSSFQPVGTVLASSTMSFLTGAYNAGYSANQVLFRCDASDKGSLYEFYATNGDNTYAGKNASSEVEGAYFSYVKNAAFRLTNLRTGEYFSRYWKRRPLESKDLFEDGTYIYVPAKAFSDVSIELIKVSSSSYSPNSSTRYTYAAWFGPFGYTAFQGGGISSGLVAGGDSSSNFSGWYANWHGGWGLYNSGVTFVRGAACAVTHYPSYILFPTTTTEKLAAGNSSQIPFDITLKCESSAVSGTTANNSKPQVAMGFLVNNATAVSAAQSLGLTSGSTGLTMLLDSNYGASSQASGVGIKIYSNKTGSSINLLSTSYNAGAGSKYSGNSNGWYGFTSLTSNAGTDSDDNVIYTGSFVASLEQISGQTVTVGAVNAQLQVLVNLQ